VAFTYLKVKSVKCFCLLPVVLLLFTSLNMPFRHNTSILQTDRQQWYNNVIYSLRVNFIILKGTVCAILRFEPISLNVL